MSSNQHYLLTQQYKNTDNFNVRVRLHAQFSTNKYSWQAWVFDHFEIPSHGRVLELGCGPAELWHHNLARIPADWDITLSDFSPGMLQEAQHKLQASDRHFSFKVIDAQSIPFEDASFDAVIANHMLYHVPDRPKAYAEIRHVLKPGGHLYAATNGQNHMREAHKLVDRFDSDTMGSWFSRVSSLPFRLENGHEELSPWFSTIVLHRYEGNLIVTEAEPLIAYVLSMFRAQNLTGDKVAQFARFVEQELAAHGSIHITKDTGMFIAS